MGERDQVTEPLDRLYLARCCNGRIGPWRAYDISSAATSTSGRFTLVAG